VIARLAGNASTTNSANATTSPTTNSTASTSTTTASTASTTNPTNPATPTQWVLLSVHMDTAGGYTGIHPIVGTDGIIRSDGTTILGGDDKAGIAITLELLQVFKDHPELAHPGIEVAVSVSEEEGLVGSSKMDKSQLKAKWGYVLDIGGPIGTICYAAPYTRYLDIQIQGKTSHAGVSPEKGINAIDVFAKAVAQLKIGRIDEETITNISTVQSSNAHNVVPAALHAEGMVRSIDKHKLEDQTAKFNNALQNTAAEYGATARLTLRDAYAGYKVSTEEKPYKLALQVFDKLGFTAIPERSTGGTDANHYNGAGLQCVGLSVGQTNPHALDEQIAINDVYDAARVQLEILLLAAGEG
jgi:tripeptide aminopeptidase